LKQKSYVKEPTNVFKTKSDVKEHINKGWFKGENEVNLVLARKNSSKGGNKLKMLK
jgi:hypothetical protein